MYKKRRGKNDLQKLIQDKYKRTYNDDGDSDEDQLLKKEMRMVKDPIKFLKDKAKQNKLKNLKEVNPIVNEREDEQIKDKK